MAKKLKTIAVIIAFLIAFALPVGLVIGLSEAEKQEYQPVEGFDFSGDYAYGAVVQPEYRTMREYMLVSGTYMPYATQFVDLSSYSGLRFYVEAGDEIAAGQTIAVADGGEEVLPLNQDAWISRIELEAGACVQYPLHRDGNGCYAFLIDGEVEMADTVLAARDAVGVTGVGRLEVRAVAASRLLLVEVPMQDWKRHAGDDAD